MDPFDTMFTFLAGLLVALLAITVLVALVYILTGLLNSTRRAERAAAAALQEALNGVPRESQEAFLSYTNQRAKSPTLAVFLALFLGWLGAHRFYLRDYGLGFVFLAYFLLGIPAFIAFVYFYYNPVALSLAWIAAILLFLWLGIPALVAFGEAFFMPRRAYERNMQTFREAGSTFRAPAAPAAPLTYEPRLSSA